MANELIPGVQGNKSPSKFNNLGEVKQYLTGLQNSGAPMEDISGIAENIKQSHPGLSNAPVAAQPAQPNSTPARALIPPSEPAIPELLGSSTLYNAAESALSSAPGQAFYNIGKGFLEGSENIANFVTKGLNLASYPADWLASKTSGKPIEDIQIPEVTPVKDGTASTDQGMSQILQDTGGEDHPIVNGVAEFVGKAIPEWYALGAAGGVAESAAPAAIKLTKYAAPILEKFPGMQKVLPMIEGAASRLSDFRQGKSMIAKSADWLLPKTSEDAAKFIARSAGQTATANTLNGKPTGMLDILSGIAMDVGLAKFFGAFGTSPKTAQELAQKHGLTKDQVQFLDNLSPEEKNAVIDMIHENADANQILKQNGEVPLTPTEQSAHKVEWMKRNIDTAIQNTGKEIGDYVDSRPDVFDAFIPKKTVNQFKKNITSFLEKDLGVTFSEQGVPMFKKSAIASNKEAQNLINGEHGILKFLEDPSMGGSEGITYKDIINKYKDFKGVMDKMSAEKTLPDIFKTKFNQFLSETQNSAGDAYNDSTFKKLRQKYGDLKNTQRTLENNAGSMGDIAKSQSFIRSFISGKRADANSALEDILSNFSKHGIPTGDVSAKNFLLSHLVENITGIKPGTAIKVVNPEDGKGALQTALDVVQTVKNPSRVMGKIAEITSGKSGREKLIQSTLDLLGGIENVAGSKRAEFIDKMIPQLKTLRAELQGTLKEDGTPQANATQNITEWKPEDTTQTSDTGENSWTPTTP